MSKDKISKSGDEVFKKAIQLPNGYVITYDYDGIDIWIKDQLNDDGYSHLKNIILENHITDILSVNSEYFVSSLA